MKNFLRFLLFLLLVATLLRVDFFFKVVYFFLAVYVLSRLWSRRSLQHLAVERHFIPRAFLGDTVAVELVIRNASRLPVPWLEVNEALPVQLATPPFHQRVVSLGPREGRQLTYRLQCRRRGYFPVGPLRLKAGDLLGFAQERKARVAPAELIVYPKIVPLQRLGLPARSPQVVLPARSPLFEDPARIMGVRDYEPGDSPRRIHWPATASTGHLLVKQYEPAIARDTLICLDMDEGHYEHGYRFTATELGITVAASIANHVIVQEGLPVGLVTQGYDPRAETEVQFHRPPRAERAQLIALLEFLARVQVTTDVPFAKMIRAATADLSWGSTLTVITGDGREPLFETLVLLRRSGFAVTLLLIQPGRPSRALQQRARMLGIRVHRIWETRDLELWS